MEHDRALPGSPMEDALLHEHFAYFVSLAEVSVLNDAEDDECPGRVSWSLLGVRIAYGATDHAWVPPLPRLDLLHGPRCCLAVKSC